MQQPCTVVTSHSEEYDMEDDDSEAFQFLLTLLQVMPVLILAYAVEFGVAARVAAKTLNLSERLQSLPRLLQPRYVVVAGASAETFGLLVAALDAVRDQSLATIIGSAALAVACIYLLGAVVFQIVRDI
jgi:hypothetical protein